MVSTVEEGDIILLFNEKDPVYFEIFLINDKIKSSVNNNEFADYIKLFFIRCRNRHNAKRQALADISKKRFYKQC